jgi:hypothetical protein
MTAATVTLPEYYQIHLIYYVDPVTGGLVNVNEHQTVSLRNPATGAQALLLFDADLIATPASVSNIAAIDGSGRNKVNLIETVLPLVLGIVGAVALIVGVLLARRRRPTMEDELETMSRKLAPASADRPDRPTSPRHAITADRDAPAHHAAPPDQPTEPTAKLAGIVPGLDPDETAAKPEEAEPPEPSSPAPR